MQGALLTIPFTRHTCNYHYPDHTILYYTLLQYKTSSSLSQSIVLYSNKTATICSIVKTVMNIKESFTIFGRDRPGTQHHL